MAPPLLVNTGHPIPILSQRATAMFLASVFAIALLPSLYMDWESDRHRLRYESSMIGSAFVLPMVLAALIIAIKATSSSTASTPSGPPPPPPLLSPEPSWVLRIGGSPWGLAGVLLMMMLVLSWPHSVQHFFWE